MDTFYDIMESADRQVRDMIQGWTMVRPDEVGLDRRAGYDLWISDEGLITSKGSDRTLQYYGGFEYVDKDFRMELGDWVMYSSEDERVQDCLDHYNAVEMAQDEA
jgi:hypothetical protein